jgi:decaprenylphospho-beta-D-erythro-pentofuranosid-2-ulose 2-reductase
MKILIIGATSAIAMEVAKLYASDGAELFLIARNDTRLDALKADLVVRGAGRVAAAVADLSDCTKHDALLAEAEHALGPIDIVLIAHGTLSDQAKCQQSFAATAVEFQTNFLSIVSLLTLLANRFEARRAGTIAVISSVAGDRGRQSNYVYGAAKGAISIFLEGLRNRLHHAGVHVVTIKPGFVDTPMTQNIKKGSTFRATNRRCSRYRGCNPLTP